MGTIRPTRARGGARASWALVSSLALALGVGASAPAGAFDFFDGRLEVHGFYEMQMRAIARDFAVSDGLDMTQWYHVLNVEIEADIAPDGFGPFDLVSMFARIEARYDCVWRRGCWMLPNVDAFGDRPGRVPKRLADGRRAGFRSTGNLFNGDERFLRDIPREFLPYTFRDRKPGSRVVSPWFNIQGIDTLFDTAGVDGVFGTADDPAPFYFSDLLEDRCDFNFRATRGSQNGRGHQILGPWQPACEIRPNGKLRGKPNPLRAKDISPITGMGGFGELPLRPVPRVEAGSNPLDVPQGVYYPNERLQQLIAKGRFGDFDQNFTMDELAWNRGASQQDDRELRELYFDIEMFDSRLWLRLGKQTIIWGKTELFRNQDQWNPQDLALASLPSLEESRIALWAARGVWHFWEVGPLSDLRAELVVLFDHFEPTDLGRCGEPYAPNPVCNKTLGLFVHGVTGFGAAGEIRPPDPQDSLQGFEIGGRLEWRWRRFSFALTDYWGWTDLPFQEFVFRYSRNVDPKTGRPRRLESEGECRSGTESACLGPRDALRRHSVNQQLFSMICATSIGLNALDRTACGQTVFNSPAPTVTDPTDPFFPFAPLVVVAVGNILSGQAQPGTGGAETIFSTLTGLSEPAIDPAGLGFAALTRFPDVQLSGMGRPTPLVPLSRDFNRVPAAMRPPHGPEGNIAAPAGSPGSPIPAGSAFNFNPWRAGGMSQFLTDEQEALLGCGPFYRTNCDADGADLMNAEATALFQSFPGIAGTSGDAFLWNTTDRSRAQPGTVGFDGGPACTRFERGRTFILPGCRGRGDPGYDPRVDGTTTGGILSAGGTFASSYTTVGGSRTARVHPFTGQRFRSETAVLSWNALMALVGLSFSEDPDGNRLPPTEIEFDPKRPFRTDGCSFALPQICSNVQSFFQITGVQRNTVNAGGNERFGRRDFVWHGGADVVLRYQKRNILGFSMDFAEDVTKSNVGIEFTWEDDVLLADNDRRLGLTEVDRYNLTVSIDRPTFVNFLNANRTFFINTQIFFQYVDGYRQAFTSNGPWNILAVFLVQTGYLDDRLLPSFTGVYDLGSNSGALIGQLQYRYTAEFSVSFGVAAFYGREEPRRMALTPTSLGNRTGRDAFRDFVENGLSAVRDRDEVFLRLRYTF